MIPADRFIDTISHRLQTASGIEIVRAEGLSLTSADEREVLAGRLEAYLGRPLSAELRRRLKYPRELVIYWESRQEQQQPRVQGEICLHNIADSLLEKDMSFLDYARNPELMVLEEYRRLDEHPYIGSGHATLIALDQQFADVELAYRYEHELHPLLLSYEEYVECLTMTMGYEHWQLLFCSDLSARLLAHMRGEFREQMAKYLNIVWPGIKLKRLWNLVDRAT